MCRLVMHAETGTDGRKGMDRWKEGRKEGRIDGRKGSVRPRPEAIVMQQPRAPKLSFSSSPAAATPLDRVRNTSSRSDRG